MFIVLLQFSKNKHLAGDYMNEHKAWIQRGVSDGVFLLVGSLQPGLGGGILASNITEAELQARLAEDPFVIHRLVEATVLNLAPSITDPRLAFLATAPA